VNVEFTRYSGTHIVGLFIPNLDVQHTCVYSMCASYDQHCADLMEKIPTSIIRNGTVPRIMRENRRQLACVCAYVCARAYQIFYSNICNYKETLRNPLPSFENKLKVLQIPRLQARRCRQLIFESNLTCHVMVVIQRRRLREACSGFPASLVLVCRRVCRACCRRKNGVVMMTMTMITPHHASFEQTRPLSSVHHDVTSAGCCCCCSGFCLSTVEPYLDGRPSDEVSDSTTAADTNPLLIVRSFGGLSYICRH
jgi:hypothetical protein